MSAEAIVDTAFSQRALNASGCMHFAQLHLTPNLAGAGCSCSSCFAWATAHLRDNAPHSFEESPTVVSIGACHFCVA